MGRFTAPDHEEADAKAQHERLTHYYGDILPSHHEAISAWTSDHSKGISDYLLTGKVSKNAYDHAYREHDVSKKEFGEECKDFHWRLQDCMERQGKAPEPIHSYSAISPKFSYQLRALPVGSVHKTATWISSSLSPVQCMSNEGADHIHFFTPEGHKTGMYVGGSSTCPDELEYLVGHETSWRKVGQSTSNTGDIVHHFVPHDYDPAGERNRDQHSMWDLPGMEAHKDDTPVWRQR